MSKEFTTRDSATAYLRRNKIQKDLYNNFITKFNDKFVVDTRAVEHFLLGDKSVEQNSKKNISTKPKEEIINTPKLIQGSLVADKTIKGGVKENVSSVARQLIKDGKTNKEIWAILKDKFKLDDSKKHYPAWYRSQAKRNEAKTN